MGVAVGQRLDVDRTVDDGKLADAVHPARCPAVDRFVLQALRAPVGPGEDVPPAVRVVTEQQPIAVPQRISHGAAVPTGDVSSLAEGGRLAEAQVRDPQGRAVPRHVRVVPLKPGHPRAVGVDERPADEVRASDQDGALARREVDVHDLVDRLLRPVDVDVAPGPVGTVRLADRHERLATREDRHLGPPDTRSGRRFGGHRGRGPVDDAVDALVVPAAGQHHAVAGAERPPAVLADPRAGVEPDGGEDLGTVRTRTDDGDAPAVGRVALQPQDVGTVHDEVVVADGRRRQVGSGQRGRPGAVRGDDAVGVGHGRVPPRSRQPRP